MDTFLEFPHPEIRAAEIMFGGLTQREQQVILALIVLISIGLGMQTYRSRGNRQVIYADSGFVTQEKRADHTPALGGWPAGQDTAAQLRVDSNPDDYNLKKDLNTASLDDLLSLANVGKARAQAVIEYREQIGGFTHIEQVRNISGIGDKTYQAIAARYHVASEQNAALLPADEVSHGIGQASADTLPQTSGAVGKVNINTASLEELCTLEDIGDTLARRIIEYRERQGGFRRAEDIQNVKGIGEGRYIKNKDRICVR